MLLRKVARKLKENGLQGLKEDGRKWLIYNTAQTVGPLFSETLTRFIQNPVFIVGCGRSGTKILANTLSSHRAICNFSEGNDTWDPLRYPWREKQPDQPPPWVDPNEYHKGWRLTESLKNNIKGTFGAFQFLSRKEYFLNKSPYNTFRIPEILEMFPQAKFIHIYRDGRAVTLSWAKKQHKKIRNHPAPYKNRELYYSFDDLLKKIANSWVDHIVEVDNQVERFNLKEKGQFLELSYEEFCRKPKKNLENVLKYLGLSAKEGFDISDFSHIENRNYKWQEQLDRNLINDLENMMSPVLWELGYEKF